MPPYIGPIPDPPEEPMFPTPWRVGLGGHIRDAKDQGIYTYVAGLREKTNGAAERQKIAALVVKAVNEHYGAKPTNHRAATNYFVQSAAAAKVNAATEAALAEVNAKTEEALYGKVKDATEEAIATAYGFTADELKPAPYRTAARLDHGGKVRQLAFEVSAGVWAHGSCRFLAELSSGSHTRHTTHELRATGRWIDTETGNEL